MKHYPADTSIIRLMCITVFLAVCFCITSDAAPPEKKAVPTQAKDTSAARPGQGYRIDQPGTITFTVGMVIKGKIEKPQVMIFLPKQNSYYRELKFNHSFANELNAPLPFSPFVE